MDPHKRNCFYNNEKQLDFFPVYSEPNCALECAWKHASITCGCAPWFLVKAFRGASPMCEAYGNGCFKRIVDTRYLDNFGDMSCMQGCLPDCNEYAFTAMVSKESKFSHL